MIKKLFFIVNLLIGLILVNSTPAQEFKIGEYSAYAIIGEANLLKDADYISFTGDFGFRGQLPPDKVIEHHLSHESSLLKNFQLRVINFEFMLSGVSGLVSDRQIDNAMITILKKDGYDLIARANNHALDFGTEGIRYNSVKLEKAGLSTIGTREFPVHYWETGGYRVAIYSLTDYIDHPDPERLILRLDEVDLSLVKRLNHDSHFQIAFVHLGSMSSFVSPHEHQQVERLLKAGIDLVVCTGSHFIKGIVTTNGKPVAYGIGNHLFSYVDNETEPIGMHLVAGFISGEFAQLFVVPFYNSIWEGKTGPLNKTDFELFKKNLGERSSQDTKLYFSDPRNLNNLKDQFRRFRLNSLKEIKLRHIKYAAEIVWYNYPIITVVCSMAITVALGLLILKMHFIRRQRRN